jgi:hypothetical protein
LTAEFVFPYQGRVASFGCPEVRIREYTRIEVYEAYAAFHNAGNMLTQSDINAARPL